MPSLTSDIPFSSYDAVSGESTWLGDAGAGRNIGGISDVGCSSIGPSPSPVTFATGGGSRAGVDSCRVVGCLTSSNECYLLKDSPWALSIGDQVRQGKAFVWLPREAMMFQMSRNFQSLSL